VATNSTMKGYKQQQRTILNIHTNNTYNYLWSYLWAPQYQRPICATLDLWGSCASPGSWGATLDFSADHYHPD